MRGRVTQGFAGQRVGVGNENGGWWIHPTVV